jgi:hypothetical protein
MARGAPKLPSPTSPETEKLNRDEPNDTVLVQRRSSSFSYNECFEEQLAHQTLKAPPTTRLCNILRRCGACRLIGFAGSRYDVLARSDAIIQLEFST